MPHDLLVGKLRLEVATDEPVNILPVDTSWVGHGDNTVSPWGSSACDLTLADYPQTYSPEYARAGVAARATAGAMVVFTPLQTINATYYTSAAVSVSQDVNFPTRVAQYRVNLYWYNSLGTQIGTTNGPWLDRAVGTNDAGASYAKFVRPELYGVLPPSGAASVRVGLETNDADASAKFHWNGAVLIQNPDLNMVQDAGYIDTMSSASANRIENPSGEQGVVNWQEGNSALNLVTRGRLYNPETYGITYPAFWDAVAPERTELIMLNVTAGPAQVSSNWSPIAAGEYVSGRVAARGKTNAYCFVFWQFYDANGTLISSHFGNGIKLNPDSVSYVSGPIVQAPANSASVRMVVRNNPDSTTTLGNQVQYSWLMYKNATMTVSATAPTAYDPPTPPAIKWRNILGSTHSINVEREELSVGTLTATILDPRLDPAKFPSLKRGMRVRVQALSNGAWHNLFVGNVHSATTKYNKKGKPRITLTATDAVAVLANTRSTRGVNNLQDLSRIVPASVKWAYNGKADSSGSAVSYIYTNDNGNWLDIAVVARDTAGGFVYVDKSGTLRIETPTYMGNTVRTYLSDGAHKGDAKYVPYINLDSGYNMDELVNVVNVKRWENVIGTDGIVRTEEKTYGPYTNTTSVSQYGASALDLTVTTSGSITPQSIAQAYLDKYGTPVPSAKDAMFKVMNESTLGHAATLELYDTVQVIHAAAGIDSAYRVSKVSHTITATTDGTEPVEWEVELGFKGSGALAVPVPTTSSPSTPVIQQPTKVDPFIGLFERTTTANFTDVETSVVSGNVTTPNGVRCKVTAQVRSFASTASGDVVSARLYRDGTMVQEMNLPILGVNLGSTGVNVQAVVNGTGTSNTWSLRVTRVAGSGTVSLFADASRPTFLLIERMQL